MKRMVYMRDEVEAVLNQIKPVLQVDGGDVELVDVSQGTVKVRIKVAGWGCSLATTTLKDGIERMLKEKLPELKTVVAV